MLIYGIICIIWGIALIIFPQLVAYFIAFFFILSGINIILLYFLSARKSKEGVVIGKYKVVKE